MRRWPVFCVALVVVLAACGQGDAEVSSTSTTVATTTSTTVATTTSTTIEITYVAPPEEEMAGWHDAMLESHSSLVAVRFEEVLDREKRTTQVSMKVLETLWPAPTASREEVLAIEDLTVGEMTLNEGNFEAFETNLPFTAVAMIQPGGYVWNIAKRGDEPGSIDPIGAPHGSSRLGHYAITLFEDPINPLPDQGGDWCDPDENDDVRRLEPRPVSPEATILAYLDLLGDKTLNDYQVESGRADALAEEIAESVDMVDPVTGESVYGDVNDIYRQLKDGVDPDDLEIRPVVNVGIGLQVAIPDRHIVFVAPPDEILSWIPARLGTNLIELRAPSPGIDVAVYLRDSAIKTDCPAGLEDETPVLVIPYDDIAGSKRALIRIGEENSYEPLPDSLITGG